MGGLFTCFVPHGGSVGKTPHGGSRQTFTRGVLGFSNVHKGGPGFFKRSQGGSLVFQTFTRGVPSTTTMERKVFPSFLSLFLGP